MRRLYMALDHGEKLMRNLFWRPLVGPGDNKDGYRLNNGMAIFGVKGQIKYDWSELSLRIEMPSGVRKG